MDCFVGISGFPTSSQWRIFYILQRHTDSIYLLLYHYIMKKILSLWLFFLSSLFVVLSASALANPASEKCIADKWSTHINTDGSGNRYSLCIFPEWTICDEWSYYRGTCARSILIDSIRALPNTEVKVTFPTIGVNKIDKKIKDYISKQLRYFEYDALDFASWTENSNFYLSIDCKPVTINESYYSVLCDRSDFLWWAHGSFSIETFNFDRKTNKQISIVSLVGPWKLKLLSDNLYRYFVLDMQATDDDSKKRIKDGLDPMAKVEYLANRSYPVNYKDFTIHGSWEKINNLTFYFEPYSIGPRAAGTKIASVAYPSLKMMK